MTEQQKPPPPPWAAQEQKLLDALNRVWRDSRTALIEAFDAGRMAGKNEAAADLRAKIAGVLEEPKPAPDDDGDDDGRAPRGSVKPTVIDALREYGAPGLKPAEIASRTGLNENSVRGALNKLKDEGITDKLGDLWVLVKK